MLLQLILPTFRLDAPTEDKLQYQQENPFIISMSAEEPRSLYRVTAVQIQQAHRYRPLPHNRLTAAQNTILGKLTAWYMYFYTSKEPDFFSA